MSRKPIMTRRLRRHEDHVNHEAWAIPYGDLVTLLLAFFVVMYAISSVNAGKYRVLSDSLFAAFRGSPRTMNPIQVGQPATGSGSELESAAVQSQLSGQQRSTLAPVPVDGGNPAAGGSPIASHVAGSPSAALTKVADEVARAMDDLVKQNMVVVRRSEFWIEVEIKTDILFPSGSAQLGTNSADVIQRLGAALAPFPNSIRVEGHTDNKPIKTVAFYSNWELSAARAGSVVRVLQSRGVAPERLAVIGYGEQRPVQSNDTEQGRNANRRVVVVILSTELQRQKAGEDPSTGTTPPAPAVASPTAATTMAPAPTPAAANTTPGATTLSPASASAAAAQSAGTPPGATAPSLSPPTATNIPTAPTGDSLAGRSVTTPATPGLAADMPTAHVAPPIPATTRVQLVNPAPSVTASTPTPNSSGMVRAP
jgi:chemotaxis protein MotB